MGSAANQLARRALLLAAAGILAACGDSGALDGPGPDSPTRPGSTQTDAGGADPEYKFTLPQGKRGADQHEATAYAHLHDGDCDAAQRHLDENWRGFDGPRNVLLFQAGVELCRDDIERGRHWFQRAGEHGWAGTQRPNVCELFRAAASVVQQRPQDSVTCQPGDPPPWPTDDESARDDPRTDVDEGAGQATGDPDGGDPDGGVSPEGGAGPDGEASPEDAGPNGGAPDDSPDTTE